MILSWLSANLPTLVTCAAVLALTALGLRNILPRKGKHTGCSCGCAGCNGCNGCTRQRQ